MTDHTSGYVKRQRALELACQNVPQAHHGTHTAKDTEAILERAKAFEAFLRGAKPIEGDTPETKALFKGEMGRYPFAAPKTRGMNWAEAKAAMQRGQSVYRAGDAAPEVVYAINPGNPGTCYRAAEGDTWWGTAPMHWIEATDWAIVDEEPEL